MRKSGQHEPARHISHQVFRNARARANFYKKALTVVSYTTACAIVALAMAYWPASAGNILTKLNVLPAHLTSASDVSNRIHKADRLSGMSFGERWRAVPTPSAVIGGDRNRREAPRAESRERIPFSCELAFSRLVTKGNFSTRCIADLETSPINT
jgi:hypothetical protein